MVDKIYDMPNSSVHIDQAYATPSLKRIGSVPAVRAKTAINTARGPYNYSDPWRTTYKNSYTGRGFGI